MCLYSLNLKPLVADKDITVYKNFRKIGSCLETPFQKVKVKYVTKMSATGEMPCLLSDYSNNNIGTGMIHSYIRLNKHFDRITLCKATIKAGTPFFVSFDGKEIASRELYINKEEENACNNHVMIAGELAYSRKYIIGLLRNNKDCIGLNNIRVGDVLLADKTFITPEEINCTHEAIGIVSFIRNDGSPHVISLREELKKWTKKPLLEMVNHVSNYEDVVKDFDGKEHTDCLRKAYGYCLKDFPSLEYCLRYRTAGTKEGDWYMPSTGEMLQTVRNTFIINDTVLKLNGRADKVSFEGDYWTSCEADSLNTWYCNVYDACCNQSYFKWGSHYVRPSLNLK